jgi:hypothetical protein
MLLGSWGGMPLVALLAGAIVGLARLQSLKPEARLGA